MKMKFAIVGEERREAQRGLFGRCPVCGAAVVAKCGDVRAWHWAHRGRRNCDPWWEPETEWHRNWKNHFPKDWQEVIHTSIAGGKHIADVKTECGVVLEFQHSFLPRDERESRERFYPRMVWVVDGQRRERDATQFFASLPAPIGVYPGLPIYSAPTNASALLRDWGASRVPVYFDFGADDSSDTTRLDSTVLWRLSPRSRDGRAFLLPVARAEFLRIHLKGELFDEMCAQFAERVADHLRREAVRYQPLPGFARYSAWRRKSRPHF